MKVFFLLLLLSSASRAEVSEIEGPQRQEPFWRLLRRDQRPHQQLDERRRGLPRLQADPVTENVFRDLAEGSGSPGERTCGVSP